LRLPSSETMIDAPSEIVWQVLIGFDSDQDWNPMEIKARGPRCAPFWQAISPSKFALEIAAGFALAYWGATVGSGIVSELLGIATPLIAIGFRGTFAAPRATRRLELRWRAPFELGLLAVAALAVLTVSAAVTVVFALVVTVNSPSLTAFGQWEA